MQILHGMFFVHYLYAISSYFFISYLQPCLPSPIYCCVSEGKIKDGIRECRSAVEQGNGPILALRAKSIAGQAERVAEVARAEMASANPDAQQRLQSVARRIDNSEVLMQSMRPTYGFVLFEVADWGLCVLRHGIQNSVDAILACHPALSTE